MVHEEGAWCRLTALVVEEGYRNQGVGEALVGAFEDAARAAGCSRVEATSATERGGAHRFYLRLGYERRSEHFPKPLAEMKAS